MGGDKGKNRVQDIRIRVGDDGYGLLIPVLVEGGLESSCSRRYSTTLLASLLYDITSSLARHY